MLRGRTFAASDVVVAAIHVTAALAPLVTLQDSVTPAVTTAASVVPSSERTGAGVVEVSSLDVTEQSGAVPSLPSRTGVVYVLKPGINRTKT